MIEYLRNLLSADALSPHGICLLWRPELVWTHALSDAVIGAAYFSIPVALAYFVTKRSDVAFTWIFWAFAVFILACGTTHFFSIWTLWFPDYGVEALIKAMTALASIATAIALWPLLPQALALPSPAQLRAANTVLETRVRERDDALHALRAESVERFKAEEMLRQAQKMEAVGQLTGGIAHDFNNLLTVVLGNLEAIAAKADPADASLQRAVRNSRLAAERAAGLTEKLLAFARKQPLQPRVTDVNALVEGMLGLLGRALGEKVAVEAKLDPGVGRVRVDPNQLENALINLAVNARDAMGGGGRLTIATRNVPGSGAGSGSAGSLLIEVSDTGTGMSEAVKQQAFEPFFTTKPVGQGSGLGLSQVHGFVTQSEGRVEIDSELGGGTSVRIFLPRTA